MAAIFHQYKFFVLNHSSTRNSSFVAKLPLEEIGFVRIYSGYDLLKDLSPIAFGGIVYIDMLHENYALASEQAMPSLKVQGYASSLAIPHPSEF